MSGRHETDGKNAADDFDFNEKFTDAFEEEEEDGFDDELSEDSEEPDVFEIEEPENLDGIEEPLDFDVDVDAVEAIAEEEIDEFSEPVPASFDNQILHYEDGEYNGSSTLLSKEDKALFNDNPLIIGLFERGKMKGALTFDEINSVLDESDLETDHVDKFFTMIAHILDERKARFAGTGFEDAVNHDGWDTPAILIVIDNYGSFHEKTGET